MASDRGPAAQVLRTGRGPCTCGCRVSPTPARVPDAAARDGAAAPAPAWAIKKEGRHAALQWRTRLHRRRRDDRCRGCFMEQHAGLLHTAWPGVLLLLEVAP